MTRTTIDLDDVLTRELKHLAADRGESTSAVVRRLLRRALEDDRRSRRRTPEFRWVVAEGVKPAPELDLTSRDWLDLLVDEP